MEDGICFVLICVEGVAFIGEGVCHTPLRFFGGVFFVFCFSGESHLPTGDFCENR